MRGEEADMTCERLEERLSALLDGECAPAEEARIRVHLASCAACRQAQADLEATGRAIESALRGHPFDDRLAARISAAARKRVAPRLREPARPARGRSVYRITAYAAAAAVLVAAGFALRLAPSAPPPDGRAPVVASITTASASDALHIQPGNSAYVPAGRRFDLREGDRIRAERATLTLAYADGSEVRVHPDTTVELRRGSLAIVEGPGSVYASVTPIPPGGAAFHVVAGPVDVAVLGTRFGVTFDGRGVATTVLAGSVRVSSRDRAETVGAGERLAIAIGTNHVLSRSHDPLEAAQALSWATGAKPVRPAPPLEPTRPSPIERLDGPASTAPADGHEPSRPSTGADLPIGPSRGEKD
jgi:ferric-dicitrate binding protein FerR (iron transport regulator)